MNRDIFDLAFKEAKKAYNKNEVPVGAIIVKDGKIISCAHNQKEKKKCCIYHAEMIAIKKATKCLNNWRLDDCDMYVTLDPCPMCASAIKQSRIRCVYSALSNSDDNYNVILNDIFSKDNTNPGVLFQTNLDTDKSKKLLNSFFEKQRKK